MNEKSEKTAINERSVDLFGRGANADYAHCSYHGRNDLQNIVEKMGNSFNESDVPGNGRFPN